MSGKLDGECTGGKLDRMSERVMNGFGVTMGGSVTFNSATEAADAESKLRRRCYPDHFDMTPAALSGPPQGGQYHEDPNMLRRGAEQPNDAILKASPGPARDKALKEYVRLRMLMLNDALYFFGKAGLDDLNRLYTREDHQRVIALLAERLRDPAFTARDRAGAIANYRLFATAPFEALPCDVVAETSSDSRSRASSRLQT
jgi:hypothetical protein